MGHKNYKWNISEEKGRNIVHNLIEKLLKERSDKKIEIEELVFLLNNRTKNMNITNNNKKKNICNFIKNVYGGITNFIDNYDLFLLDMNEKNTFVRLNELELNEWIIIEDDQ